MYVQFAGYTLTTSSDNATVGLEFTFTCVTTETLIAFTRDVTNVCIFTGGNTDGTCVFGGGYNTNYTYTCNTTTITYTVTIPRSYLTESLHGTRWKCQNPSGGGVSNTKILYVNGALLYRFNIVVLIDLHFLCILIRDIGASSRVFRWRILIDFGIFCRYCSGRQEYCRYNKR